METIGIFGGSFDPPHLGHVMCCTYAHCVYELPCILVIPTGRHPFGKPLAPAEDRLEMARRAFRGLSFCAVSTIEIDRAAADSGRPSYMIDTLRAIARERPGAALRLVAGDDLGDEIASWHDGKEVLAMAPPAWVPRAVEGEERGLEEDFAIPAWSGTRLRERIGRGADVSRQIPASVLRHIRGRGLYGARKK